MNTQYEKPTTICDSGCLDQGVYVCEHGITPVASERQHGHSALRIKNGKLETFDPHPQWKWTHGAMLPQSIEELEIVVNAAIDASHLNKAEATTAETSNQQGENHNYGMFCECPECTGTTPIQKQLTWPTIEEQQEYWRVRDKDLDKIESATQFYDERAFDGEDAEEWQRRSDQQGAE